MPLGGVITLSWVQFVLECDGIGGQVAVAADDSHLMERSICIVLIRWSVGMVHI